MIDKVNTSSVAILQYSNARAAQTSNTPPVSPAQAQASGSVEQLSLSADAAKLQGLEQVIRDAPVVDSAKIEPIRQAISNGTYEVDNNAVAEKLIASERSLDNSLVANARASR